MNFKLSFAAVLLFGSTTAHAAIISCSQTCVKTQTSWTAQDAAGLSEGPAESSAQGTGSDLPSKTQVTSPTAEQETYTGNASTFISGGQQTISLQAIGNENTYDVSTGYASAMGSLVYGFMIVGPPNPFGVAVTAKGSGKTDSNGAAGNTVDMSIVLSEVDGDSPPITLLSQNSIGTVNYTETFFLFPGIEYQVDMEATVYTNALVGHIDAVLDPNFTVDAPGYTLLFGDGIGNRIRVPTAPEPSTWAMLLIGFAGLGFAGYRRTKAA